MSTGHTVLRSPGMMRTRLGGDLGGHKNAQNVLWGALMGLGRWRLSPESQQTSCPGIPASRASEPGGAEPGFSPSEHLVFPPPFQCGVTSVSPFCRTPHSLKSSQINTSEVRFDCHRVRDRLVLCKAGPTQADPEAASRTLTTVSVQETEGKEVTSRLRLLGIRHLVA